MTSTGSGYQLHQKSSIQIKSQISVYQTQQITAFYSQCTIKTQIETTEISLPKFQKTSVKSLKTETAY